MLIGSIDLGGTKTIAALLNERGEILRSEHFYSPQNVPWEKHFEMAAAALRKCCSENFSTIAGVGINMPGLVNPFQGELIYAPFQDWRHVPVKEYFTTVLGIENILVENDVNSCAVGEMTWGGGVQDFVWITLSTGNGGAVVSGGKLLRGTHYAAGEFGHLKVEYENPRLCNCGQKGCLEAYASGTAIFRNYGIDAKQVAENAHKGDGKALDIFEEVGKYIGRAISYAISLNNPEKVFLGGGLAESIDLLLPAIQMEIKSNVLPVCANIKIEKTKLGYHAALLGAGALVLRKVGIK